MNKKDLADKILLALSKEGTTDREEAKRIAAQVSMEIASAIDEYIQHEIGARLEIAMESLYCTDRSGSPTPLTPGPDFPIFSRKTDLDTLARKLLG